MSRPGKPEHASAVALEERPDRHAQHQRLADLDTQAAREGSPPQLRQSLDRGQGVAGKRQRRARDQDDTRTT